MSKASEFEAQAAHWLVRREADDFSAHEREQFEAWMHANRRHRAAFLRLETAWRHADRLNRLRPLDGSVNEDLLAQSPFLRLEELPTTEETHLSAKEEQLRGAASEADSEALARGRERLRDVLRIDDERHFGSELAANDAAHASDNPPSPDAERVFDRLRSGRMPWVFWPLVSAAAIALVAVGVVSWFAFQSGRWQHFETDFGGFERIVLDDGSIVHLNTHSAMRVQLSKDGRRVVLERGEALFKVAHDSSRPFDVRAGDTTVRAVGTEFSVRVREAKENTNGVKDVEVLVTEGRVAIDPPTQKPERAAVLPASLSTVSAGETVTITSKRLHVAKVEKTEVSRKLSWTEGRLWFERERLADVVAEFNRYNRRQMVIADPTIADVLIGGGFEATDPESFMAALERTLDIRAFPSPSDDGSEPEVIRLVGSGERHIPFQPPP